ncbi:MAG TPA: carboxypeptidase-like regulatory domain-containing protein, partial [Bryobacteraceae bacterium]|nr:carboxypeptidase-like regulatory domain-containing protein [Bryobacteraceae bacterium]
MTKRYLTLLALAMFCLCGSAWSQTITATMTGTITDPTGAVVPSAKVVATNTATNLTYETQSNDAGLFNLVFLPAGPYSVTVELRGF